MQVGLGAATGLVDGLVGGAVGMAASSDLVTAMATRLGMAEELTPVLLKAAIQIPTGAALGAGKQLATMGIYHQHISWSQVGQVGIGAAIGAGTAYFSLTTGALAKAMLAPVKVANAVSTEAMDESSDDADVTIPVKPSTTVLPTFRLRLPQLKISLSDKEQVRRTFM